MFRNTTVDDQFIDEVCEKVEGKFQPGRRHKAITNSAQQYVDPTFNGYNANFIHNTNLIAACGPKTFSDVMALISIAEKTQARHIVAIVANIGSNGYPDCLDYFDLKQFDHYDIQVIHAEIGYRASEVKKDGKKILELHAFFAKDGSFLDVNYNTKYSAAIWHLCSQTTPIIVHCRKGEGRTGAFILMCRILQNQNIRQLLNKGTTEDVGAKILSWLATMRDKNAPRCRIGLLHNLHQLTAAIKNAYQVMQYAIAYEHAPADLLNYDPCGPAITVNPGCWRFFHSTPEKLPLNGAPNEEEDQEISCCDAAEPWFRNMCSIS